MAEASEAGSDLKRTPLVALHAELGARMVPFAGYQMPVQYKTGILAEHNQVRANAGLFDVSHMGQILLRPLSGDIADAAAALETLIPMDILGLRPERQRYAFFTNDSGGVLDDLMVVHRRDHLMLVVNAACKHDDLDHLQSHLQDTCVIEARFDRALLALQGPAAESVLTRFAPAIADMRFMDAAELRVAGADCVITRSGYTGEDGFEISVDADRAEALARALLEDEAVAPIGLGARDSLRLEAGLCLYGSDITTKTSPIEAGLAWAIQKVRHCGGAREGGFPGAARILDEMDSGVTRQRVGLKPEGKAPVRQGIELFASAEGVSPIGYVTSGCFGPSVGGPVAMGYLDRGPSAPGTGVFAELRGRRVAVEVVSLPFRASRYKR